MPVGPMFPNLTAGGTIRPYRLVKVEIGTDHHTGLEGAAATDLIVGVADGRTRAYDSANHAEDGDPVHLQDGRNVFDCEAGAAITNAGTEMISDAQGRVIAAAGNTDFVVGINLEPAGAAGEIIKVYWQPYKRDQV